MLTRADDAEGVWHVIAGVAARARRSTRICLAALLHSSSCCFNIGISNSVSGVSTLRCCRISGSGAAGNELDWEAACVQSRFTGLELSSAMSERGVAAYTDAESSQGCLWSPESSTVAVGTIPKSAGIADMIWARRMKQFRLTSLPSLARYLSD